ncbi:ATP-binding protein [Promicromonospora soli]|uniref:ATP/GTP-binding protein n=1 Tax=Promicromonospora soli TaxID=2035533 RepID=A0A919FRA3_9MICO|nr:ATP-binding protein [Promicromonospora soli]GHH70956.1 ATP/GTP-binding protein [Promicromonospora soli]
MLSHISALTDGLMWTRTGTVWAVWRVSPVPYAFQPDDKKHAARRHHTALYRALRGESLHLGLTAATDPASVVLSMIEGVDLTEREAWAAECEATLDFLEQIPIGRRVHWIAAPLANPGAKAFMEPLQASWTTLQDTLMMPRSVPGRHAIGERAAQAEALRKEMPSAFDPQPATVAEMAWMFGHAMQRGLGLDTAVPVDGSLDAEMHLSGPSVLPSALVDPAGQTDSEKKLGPLQILKRPYVKVLDPTNPDLASYQTTLVVSDTPSGGIVYPGCEWIGRVDESGVPCDWAIRMTVRSRDEVTNRNRRAVRTLNDQFDQRSEEERAGSSLDTTARALGEYQAVMDADELEVEVDATTMFTVSGNTPEQALDDARDLTKYFAAMQFSLRTDPTIQPTLFEATLPGMPTPRAVREYSQITTARAFSAAVPFATTELGDTSGALFALEISNGAARPNPVFVNLAGATDKLDVALAMGFVGELGSGKSVSMKTVAMDNVDMGATLMAVDHTEMGEWGIAVSEIPGSQVVEISEDATVSMDPLRILPPAQAPRVARSFITVLLSVQTKSEQNVLLSKVLQTEYMWRHKITSLGSLARHLEVDCEYPGAKLLADEMRIFSELDFGRALFDDTLPPLDLSSPAIVLHTHKMQLPSRADMEHGHLFAELKAEKVFGRATFALIAALARYRCFADRSRLDIFAADEASKTMSSPEAAEEIGTFIRDGRKHKAALLLGSHDAEEDFGNEVVRGLIPFRVLLRHRDANLARRGLRWLHGLSTDAPVDEGLVKLVTEGTAPVTDAAVGVVEERRGECLIRDFQARYGRAKVMAPLVETRAQTVKTTPTSSTGAVIGS